MKKKQVLLYLVLFLASVGFIFYLYVLAGKASYGAGAPWAGIAFLGPLAVSYILAIVFFALLVVNLFLREKKINPEDTKNFPLPSANIMATVIGIMCLTSTLF
jgi:heme/copper-type cytochrome/quinol oxidase subunit 2